jgi:hypothetical protein
VLEGYAVEGGEIGYVAVIRNDERDLAVEFAGAPSMEQIGHAVQILRAEERHARTARAWGELPGHVELTRERHESCAETFEIEAFEAKFDAHEKEAQLLIAVLIGVQDIGSALVEKAGDARDESRAIRAVDQEDG